MKRNTTYSDLIGTAMSGEKNMCVAIQKFTTHCKIWGGKMLVWSCMAASGGENLVFINGRTAATMCVNILRANLKTSARKLGLQDCFHFQQDNNPKHTVLCSCKFLLYNGPRRPSTLSQSTNMNVIENLCSLLEVEVCEKKFLTVKQYGSKFAP